MDSGNLGHERLGGPVMPPGWYPDPAAPGGYLWWTGQEWVNPFSWPPYQPARRLSQPIMAWPSRPARHSWLLWLAAACCAALGCATACAILGTCLATGRPVHHATIALLGPIILANGVMSWVNVVLQDPSRPAYSPSALRGTGPPPQVVTAGRRAGLRAFAPTRLVWAYIVVTGATFGTLLGASLASGGLLTLMATWWAQVVFALLVALALALQCAVVCHLSRRARLMARRSPDYQTEW